MPFSAYDLSITSVHFNCHRASSTLHSVNLAALLTLSDTTAGRQSDTILVEILAQISAVGRPYDHSGVWRNCKEVDCTKVVRVDSSSAKRAYPGIPMLCVLVVQHSFRTG